MKKAIIAISAAITLYSCGPEGKRVQNPNGTSYTLLVHYVGNSMGMTPPSDTITVTLYEMEPRIYVDNGTSCLIGDDWHHPIATYVRSFKILSAKQ